MNLPPDIKRASPFGFQGGLDQTSTGLAMPGNRCIAAVNYEPVAEGYERMTGYERFDGRLPSDTNYQQFSFTNGGPTAFAVGEIITVTSGGTARVLLPPQNVTGSWASGTAAGVLVLVNATGSFNVGNQVQVSSVTRAVVASALSTNDAPTSGQDDAWTEAAHNYTRNLVQAVPGSGPVRGVTYHNGSLYAVRDNSAATTGHIYKATSSGWVLQSFGRYLRFQLGAVEPAEGQTLTGATSGATAVIKRIIVQDGDWGGTANNEANGYFVISGQTGTFQANEILRVSSVTVANNTADGDSTAVQLPAGGRYSFKVKNFYGASNRQRIYGVNGVGPGFEYDGGSVLVPIFTLRTADETPERVFEIGNALGFTFPGGSIQVSAPGEPCVFDAILGASEISMGDDITDVIDANDSAVVFFSRSKVAYLTGRDVDSFQFDEITEEAGAEPWTVQRVGKTVYLDRRGLRDLQATGTFGNFKAGALSELFERYLKAKRRQGAQPALSMICRAKTQYRLFWDDGTGFTVFMGRKSAEMMPFDLGELRVSCGFTAELDDFTEGMFVGAEDGYVYRFDSGTSFDGEGISAFVMMPFNHLGNVGLKKRGHSVRIEMVAGPRMRSSDVVETVPRTRIGVVSQWDYMDGEMPVNSIEGIVVAGGVHEFITQGGGGLWDSQWWNAVTLAEPFQGMAEADIAGAGRNLSITVVSDSTPVEPPHILQAYTVIWSPRGGVKRTAR